MAGEIPEGVVFDAAAQGCQIEVALLSGGEIQGGDGEGVGAGAPERGDSTQVDALEGGVQGREAVEDQPGGREALKPALRDGDVEFGLAAVEALEGDLVEGDGAAGDEFLGDLPAGLEVAVALAGAHL